MHRFLVLLFVFVSFVRVQAQLPSDFRSEQVFLTALEHEVLPGDTLNVEGQVSCVASNQFYPFSKYLYVELFNNKDSVLVRQKVSCKDKGYFSTRIPTEYEWPKDVYYLRAYTQLMRNFSLTSFPIQPVLIGKELPQKPAEIERLFCKVAPTGGKLVAGSPQSIVVQLTDQYRFPVSAQLALCTAQGDTVQVARTSAAGMAQFRFVPTAGESYSLHTNVPDKYVFNVPDCQDGVKVEGSFRGNRLNYQLINAPADLSDYLIYTYDRQNGFIEVADVKAQGVIAFLAQPKVVSLFLTDKTRQVIAESTIVGRSSNSYVLDAPSEIHFGAKLDYTVQNVGDSARILARVVKQNDLLATTAEQALNYQSDYASPLAFPLAAFGSENKERDLMLWLSTASFQRLTPQEAHEKGEAIYTYMPEQVMEFSGLVDLKKNRPMRDGTLVVYNRETDNVYDADLDHDGHFRIAVDDFADGDSFFLQGITKQGKAEFSEITIADETYPAVLNHSLYTIPTAVYAQSETAVEGELTKRGDVYTLPNLTVKAKTQREEKPKDTDTFYGWKRMDQQTIDDWNFITLGDIIRRMPGMQVYELMNEDIRNPITAQSKTGRWRIVGSRGEITKVLLDDSSIIEPPQYDYLMEMPAKQIELVEYLRPWQTNAYLHGAISGALRVLTRKATPQKPAPSKGTIYQPKGLTIDPAKKPESWTASLPGRYVLIVDVISPDGVISLAKAFEVVE